MGDAEKRAFFDLYVGYRTDVLSPVVNLSFRVEVKGQAMSSLVKRSLTAIERPRCGRCQTRMELLSAATKSDNSEKRIFECQKCHYIETKIVADPLTSREVQRLTSGLQRPSPF